MGRNALPSGSLNTTTDACPWSASSLDKLHLPAVAWVTLVQSLKVEKEMPKAKLQLLRPTASRWSTTPQRWVRPWPSSCVQKTQDITEKIRLPLYFPYLT